MALRAAIYVRISEDRTGAGLGVARQAEDCRALADSLGWTVAEVYTDNDVSAYQRGKRRPAYLRLVEDIRAGAVAGLLAWHTDRLHRSNRELEDFIEAISVHGTPVHTVKAGTIDLATAAGRMVARVLGATAQHESEQKAERVRRKHVELVQAGKYSGSPPTYGLRRDASGTLHVAGEEAEIVREVAERLIAGESLGGLAFDLNERKVKPTRAARWARPTLRGMLLRPSIAGLRVVDGREIEANWPAVLEVETWRKVCVVLDRHAPSDQSERRYLLSGFAVCGECGARLVSKARSGGKPTSYVCRTRKEGGCGGVRRTAHLVDGLISELVVRYLTSLDLPAVAAEGDPALPQLKELEERRERLRAAYTSGQVEEEDFFPLLRSVTDQIGTLRTGVEARGRGRVLSGAVGNDARAAWEAADLTRRRTILAEVLAEVIISKTAQRGSGFDPSAIEIAWASDGLR